MFIPERDARGRKPIENGKRMTQRMVSLDDDTVEILRAYGNGNLSQGIRDAAKKIGEKIAKPISQ